MEKKCLMGAGIHGFFAVAMGAFAAHALKQVLDADALALIQTASRYQMYHALALLSCGAFSPKLKGNQVKQFAWSSWGFLLGAAVFSGSLYLMAFSGIRILGAFTPVGGLMLLAAWINLVIFSLRYL